MRAAKSSDFTDLVCPITHELPTRPVVAQDGKVYDEAAWMTYVKTNKHGNKIKSPWTMKTISKDAYFSVSLRQVIEKAVRDGHVSKDLHPSWKMRMKQENEIEMLKKELKKNPFVAMTLGDHYYHGSHGVSKDVNVAQGYYEKGYSRSKDAKKEFYIKILLCGANLPSRTRTDMICIWSSLCQMMENELVSYTVHTIMAKFEEECRDQVAKMSGLLHNELYSHASFPNMDFKRSTSEEKMANDCAKQLASFLKENAEGSFHSDSNSDEDSESEESES